jgi:hypothetical protein
MPAHVEYDIATTDLSTKGKNNVLLKPTIEQHVPRQDVREGVCRPEEIELTTAKRERAPRSRELPTSLVSRGRNGMRRYIASRGR